MMQPFVLSPSLSRWDHWRDYARILRHGVISPEYRHDGELLLERSGPFVPAVSFPSSVNVVLTEDTMMAIARRVPQIVFRRVVLSKAVALHWTEWDARSDEPPLYPSSGEPEDYIVESPHDQGLADRIGGLWELVPFISPEIQGPKGCFRARLWRGEHLIRADVDAGINYVSSELQEALLAEAQDWVAFRPATLCREEID